MIGDSVLYFLDIIHVRCYCTLAKKIDVRNHSFQMYLKYFEKQTNQPLFLRFVLNLRDSKPGLFANGSMAMFGGWVGRRFLETL